MMTPERQAPDVAALRRLVEDERSSAETLKTAPAGSEVRREAVTTWMRSRRLLHQMLFAYAVEVVAALEKQEGLRQALREYGGHKPSCGMNLARKREGMLVGALEQVVLADADHWERVRDIARNTLEYRDSVAEAQARQAVRGVCTCGWEDVAAREAGEVERDGR